MQRDGPASRAAKKAAVRSTSATLLDVAVACGVSQATVSRAVRGLPGVSDELRAVIESTAERLGYRPNKLAQGLRTRKTSLVGLLLTNLVNASFHTVTEEVQRLLNAHGYQVLLAVSGGGTEEEDRCLSLLLDRQVDGVIMLGSAGRVPTPPSLANSTVPVVNVIRRVEPQPPDSVLADDRRGARAATSHLLALGHRRIGLIVGTADTARENERRAGYLAAHKQAGVAVDRSLIREGPYRPEVGAQFTAELLDARPAPTALFLANHEAAFGALPVIAERGLDVPRQLSVIVFEDAPWFGYWRPPLTVIDTRPLDLAALTVERLLVRLGDVEASASTSATRVRAELVIRDSCGPPGT